MFSPSGELYSDYLLFVHYVSITFSLISVVVGLLVSCSMYLLVCIVCRMYCVYIVSCCVRFRCIIVIYLFHAHGLCFCSLCLLFSCEMIRVLDCFHMRKNIYAFRKCLSLTIIVFRPIVHSKLSSMFVNKRYVVKVFYF